MKKQLKLLTDNEKYAICNKYMDKIEECPLSLKFGESLYCFKDIDVLEDLIKRYWNKEVDVDG